MQTTRRQSTGAPLEDRGQCVQYQRGRRAMSSLAGTWRERSPCCASLPRHCTTTSWQSTLRYSTWAFHAGTTRLIFGLQSGPSEWSLLNAFRDEQRWIKRCVLSAAQSHRCFLVEILSGIPNVLPPHTKLVQSQCLWCCFVFVCSIACACQSCFLFWILDLWMESFQILGRSKVSCAQ